LLLPMTKLRERDWLGVVRGMSGDGSEGGVEGEAGLPRGGRWRRRAAPLREVVQPPEGAAAGEGYLPLVDG